MNAVSDVQFRDRLKRNINRTLAFGFFQVFLVHHAGGRAVLRKPWADDAADLPAAGGVRGGRARHGNSVGICGGHPRTPRHAARRQRVHRARPFDAAVRGRIRGTRAVRNRVSASASSLVSGTDLAILYDSEAALGHDAGQRQELVGRLFTMHTASRGVGRRVVQRAADLDRSTRRCTCRSSSAGFRC